MHHCLVVSCRFCNAMLLSHHCWRSRSSTPRSWKTIYRPVSNLTFISKVTERSVQDGQLRMSEDHLAALYSLCRTCFFQFRQIRSIIRSLHWMPRRHWWTRLWQATLDYCNLLYHGIAASYTVLYRVGVVKNFQFLRYIICARSLTWSTGQTAASADCGGTGARKYDHITPVLHALPVAHLEGTLIGPCLLFRPNKNQFWPLEKIGKHGLPPLCKH